MTRQLLQQLSRFALVGSLGFIVDTGLTLSLIGYGLDAFLSRAIGLAAAMLTTWRLNRALTFDASNTSQTREGLRYFTISISVAMVNYAIFAGLLLMITTISPALAIVIATAISTGLSFFGYRAFAFKSVA